MQAHHRKRHLVTWFVLAAIITLALAAALTANQRRRVRELLAPNEVFQP